MSLTYCRKKFDHLFTLCKDPEFNYIGSTKFIKERLTQHNSGFE